MENFRFLLPEAETLRLLCRWRIPADELFALDGVQIKWYSVLSATRYVLAAYAITKSLFTWIPALKQLDHRRTSRAHAIDTSSSTQYVSKLKTIPAFIATYLVKSFVSHTVAHPVERALNLSIELARYNLLSKALRCLHYCSMRTFVTRDPVATADVINKGVAAALSKLGTSAPALGGGSPPPVAPVALPRGIIAYVSCEAFLCRFLRLFQPLGTLNAFRVCDSSQFVNDIGLDSKGKPRLSSTVVTGSTFERYSITTLDITTSFVQYFVSEFFSSFIRHGLIAKLQHGKFEWQFERHFVVLVIRIGLLVGVANPMLTRILGPTATITPFLGIQRLGIPTAMLAYVCYSFADALLTKKIYMRYVRARCLVTRVKQRIEVARLYRKSCSEQGVAPTIPSETLFRQFRRSKYSAFINKITGTDSDTLSQRELTGVRDFAAYHYVNGVDGFPFVASLRLAMALLAVNVIHLENLDDEEAKLLAKLREEQSRIESAEADGGADGEGSIGRNAQKISAEEKRRRRAARIAEAQVSLGVRRDAIVLERALRAGTLQRKNVSDLFVPLVLPNSDSVVDIASLAGSPPASPNTCTAPTNATNGNGGDEFPSASQTAIANVTTSSATPISNARRSGAATVGVEEDDPCPICLRQLRKDEDDIVVGSRCGHSFHTVCLKDCLKMNSDCPLCRAELAPANENGFVIPALLAPDAEERHPVETPENVMELLFNRTGAEIMTRSVILFKDTTHWEADHDAMINHLMNCVCKGDEDMLDVIGLVKKLDDLQRSNIGEVIRRNVPPEMKLYAEVSKLVVELFACPQLFYIESDASD